MSELLEIARRAGGKEFGPLTWNISFTKAAWEKFEAYLARRGTWDFGEHEGCGKDTQRAVSEKIIEEGDER